MNRIFSSTLFLILSLATSYSQILTFKNLNVDDGLVYSQVLCAYQEKKGYMWFGTSSGVSRWDGRKFNKFHSTDKIRFDNVKLISESADGSLSFVTRNNVIIYRKNIFSVQDNLPSPLHNWIQYSVKDDNGSLYLAAPDSGIWKFDGRKFTQIVSVKDLKGAEVTCLYLTTDKSLLIGTKTHGLFSLENEHTLQNFLPVGKSLQNISSLIQDNTGMTYIGTRGDGLYMFDGHNLSALKSNTPLPGKNVNHIYTDEKYNLYIATNNGVAIINERRIHSVITSKNGLAYDFVWWIAEDRQNNFYFCTDGGGVDIYRPGIYETFNETSGLPANTVWSVLESPESQFYIATDNGVAVLNSGNLSLINTKNGLSENMIITLHRSRDERIFFGTNESGVDILDKGRFSNLNKQNGLTSNSVWSIAEDMAGRIYFGTYDGGICVYQGGHIIDTIDTKDGLANNYIVSAYTAPDGTVYFGLDNGGLYHLVDGQLQSDEVILPGLTVWSIYQRSDGILFLGTDKTGLVIHSEAKDDTVTIRDGLSNNAILGIMEDKSGNLYLTTDNGVNVVDISAGRPHIRIITNEDGLASNECNQGAYLKDSQGYLWIGTIRGVTRYNPAADLPSIYPPQPHITQMKVFDRDIALSSDGGSRTFAYNENYIQLYFSGIDLTAPHKVRYRYRLNGTDHDWLETDYPQVQYANLNDNEYTFEVQAGNEWGVWSHPASIQFTILAPFWETWWFRVFVITGIGGIVAALIFFRVRNLLEIEKVRSKIAADLHDDIGAGLSEINILTAVAEAKTPREAKKYTETELGKIAHTARQMIENMSDIVWMVNPKNDSMMGLISRLKDSFNDVLDARGIKFRMENIHLLEKLKLSMEKRQLLFLIFKEALNNAVKYSECTEIELGVNLDRKNLTMFLRDNGNGFDAQKIRPGNGLANMHTRALKIKGTLEIISTLKNGTTIEFNGKI